MEQLERISRSRQQGQAVEHIRICHCEEHKGIRANVKQTYAGITDRRKKQAVRADKIIRAWSSRRASARAGRRWSV